MIKTIGLVGVLCAAAILGMTWARQSFQTTERAPTAILQAAATVLELNHRTIGTYDAPVLHRVRRPAHRRSQRDADRRRLSALIDRLEQLGDLGR